MDMLPPPPPPPPPGGGKPPPMGKFTIVSDPSDDDDDGMDIRPCRKCGKLSYLRKKRCLNRQCVVVLVARAARIAFFHFCCITIINIIFLAQVYYYMWQGWWNPAQKGDGSKALCFCLLLFDAFLS